MSAYDMRYAESIDMTSGHDLILGVVTAYDGFTVLRLYYILLGTDAGSH